MHRTISLVLMVAACAGMSSAAEIDPHLPNDTEIVVSFNVERALTTPFGRRYLRGILETALKSNEPAATFFKDVEFDPGTDLKQITVAMSSSAAQLSFVIVRGAFRPEKFAAVAHKIALADKSKLRIHRLNDQSLYEFPQEKEAVFAAFVSNSVLLLSTQRPLIAAVIEKKTEPFGKPKPALVTLVKQADGKQAAWLAALPEPLKRDLPIPQENPQQKQAIEKLRGVFGVLRMETELRLQLTLTAADAASAVQLGAAVDGIVKLLLFLAPGIIKEKPELAPLQDVASSIRYQVKGQAVWVTAEVTAKTLDKMLQLVQP